MTILKHWLKLLAVALALGVPVAVAAPESPEREVVPEPKSPALPDPFDDPDDVVMPDPDLWHRIRFGFALEPFESDLVHEHENWYASRPEYIKRFVDRGSRYLHYIVEQVEKRGMPMEIALLPIIESAFTPRATSRAKASGIWQFMPSTGRNYGLSQDWWRDNRNDVIKATDAALNYLQRLHDMFGSWELALAAYNCGEGCVGRAIAYNQKRGLPTNLQSLRVPPETRNYVPKLFAVKNIVLSPATYGIEIDSIPDQPYFTTVQAPARIDVKLAAKLAGMSEEDFVALNPAHNKPVAVGSGGMNSLVLPLDKADTFRANLEAYDKPLVTWTQYQAKRGESIDAIARRHGLTGAQLRAANDTLRLDKRGRLRSAGAVIVPIKAGAKSNIGLAATPPVPAAAAAKQHARVTVSTPTASSAGTPRALPKAQAAMAHARTYVVRAGDTLYGIAQRFNIAVEALRAANRLAANAVIKPGLRLQLP